MTEENKTAKHDGWKSRKALVTLGSLIAPFTAATVGLFLDRMTAQEWTGFVQFLVPLVSGLYFAGNVAEKKRVG